MFGNPQHPVTRAMLGLQHPDHPEARPSLRDGEQIVTLRFDGSSGREPNLQHIASLLGATPACCTATASVSRAGSSASCRSG